ncbi:MAG: glycosyltransferase family 2 protein, partial [Chloroflexales bacterium]|nr:glycosyltransferase family 2 protein [Chloroflexales bacterium]
PAAAPEPPLPPEGRAFYAAQAPMAGGAPAAAPRAMPTDLPLVSCIMPTADRRAFVPQAIAYFQRQDYPRRELLIVDDGDDPVADLVPDDPRVRYYRLARRMTVGAKRNYACRQALGPIIAHWDDDDWHAPHRLRYQIEALHQAGGELCGIDTLLFYDLRDGRAWRYVYAGGQRRWVAGSTLCYTRDYWARHLFAEVNVGEDTRFVWGARDARLAVLPDPNFHVGIIHRRNVSPKRTGSAYWQPYALEAIWRLLGDDRAFYDALAPTLPR